MSNIKLNCCGCGKELGLGSRVSTDGVLWRCEECAIKQREEYDNKDKKISELEAKLAESEKLKDDAFYNYAWLNQELSDIKQKLKDNEDAYKMLCCNHQNLGKTYNELEQQLAEKEKEIARLKLLVDGFDKLKQYDKDAKQIILINPDNVYADGHKLVIKKHNQDKISFAVEKLQEAKRLLEEKYTYDVEESEFAVVYEDDVDNIFDNQIEKLKKESNNG